MHGNSLIDEFNGIQLIDEKFVEDLKDRDNVILNEEGKFRAKVGKTYKRIVQSQRKGSGKCPICKSK